MACKQPTPFVLKASSETQMRGFLPSVILVSLWRLCIRSFALNNQPTSLGVAAPAMIANIVEPPTFFIKNGRLMAYVNQTSILYVNVIDPADTPAPSGRSPVRPGLFAVEFAEKQEGMAGEFFWVQDVLNFSRKRLPPPLKKNQQVQPGEKMVWKDGKLIQVGENNGGLWWACGTRHGENGAWGRSLYVNFANHNVRNRRNPDNCQAVTLRSTASEDD